MALRFAISTRLVSDERLDSSHLATFAKHGFTGVSLIASRTHVDYGDPGTVADLPAWLTRAGLTLDAVQAEGYALIFRTAEHTGGATDNFDPKCEIDKARYWSLLFEREDALVPPGRDAGHQSPQSIAAVSGVREAT